MQLASVACDQLTEHSGESKISSSRAKQQAFNRNFFRNSSSSCLAGRVKNADCWELGSQYYVFSFRYEEGLRKVKIFKD